MVYLFIYLFICFTQHARPGSLPSVGFRATPKSASLVGCRPCAPRSSWFHGNTEQRLPASKRQNLFYLFGTPVVCKDLQPQDQHQFGSIQNQDIGIQWKKESKLDTRDPTIVSKELRKLSRLKQATVFLWMDLMKHRSIRHCALSALRLL
jgi:hypothetical protein